MKEEYEALLTFLKFIKELVVNSSKLNDDVNNNDVFNGEIQTHVQCGLSPVLINSS